MIRISCSRSEDSQLDHGVLSSWLPGSSEAAKKPESIGKLVFVSVSRSVVSDSLRPHGLSIEFTRQEYWSG